MQKKLMIDHYLMVAMIIFFCILLILISYFVAPISDESLPIATSLRFIQGQSPFIDDFSAFIPLGLLIYPFVKLSLWIHHGNNELILFLRHSYLFFVLIASGYTFFLLRKKLPFIVSGFIALGISLFHPFGINNFHYDTLATLLWSTILFQFFSFQFIESINKSQLIIFSLSNLILCFAYPTFLFFLIPFYLIFFRYSLHSKKIFLSHFLMAAFTSLCLIWIIFYHFHVSMQNIHNFSNFLHQLGVASNQSYFNKFVALIHQLASSYWRELLTASAVLLVAYYGRRYWFILLPCFILVLGLPFWAMDLQQAFYKDAFFLLNYMGLLSFPLFFIFLRNDVVAKLLFYFVGLPALAAGVLTSLSSANFDLNFVIGFFPAALLAYVYIHLIIQDNLNLPPLLHYIVTRAVLLFGLLQLAFFQWNYIYGASAIGMSTYKDSVQIKTPGPFHGLYVDLASYVLLRDLQQDIQRLDKASTEQYVYFGLVSAGYLIPTHLKPGEYILYSTHNQQHYGQKIRNPSYVFDFSKYWHQPPGEIVNYLKGTHYKKIATRQFYEFYASEHTLAAELKH